MEIFADSPCLFSVIASSGVCMCLLVCSRQTSAESSRTYQTYNSVMEDQSYDMLLGLDMLRKHQASIDLKNNCLRIGSISASFLPEHKIPSRMRTMADAVHSDPAAEIGGLDSQPGSMQSDASTTGGASNSASGTAGQAAMLRANRAKSDALVALGFSRNDADRALLACGGNQDQAAALLAQEKFGF